MRTEAIHEDNRLSVEVIALIKAPIIAALNSVTTVGADFIVNPTVWYWRNPSGKIRPTVANSAKYISSKFQSSLKAMGWEIEKTIRDQTIDAYTELVPRSSIDLYRLPERNFLPLLERLRSDGFLDYGSEATALFRNFVSSRSIYFPEYAHQYIEMFELESGFPPIRVGVEFETGNIASSFRAIQKLNQLSFAEEIDVGVLVTSSNKKDGSARIWPVSNRNGSFEELTKRNYREQTSYLAVDIGFLPDAYDDGAAYLDDNGTLYAIEEVGEIEFDGVRYVEGRASGGRSLYRPAGLV